MSTRPRNLIFGDVQPMTLNQATYMAAIKRSIVTLCTGPAGSGKTFLACFLASEAIKQKRVKKVIICRPMVICGERDLGALPGDVDEKVSPYMRAVIDCFGEFFEHSELKLLMSSKTIEIQPLELMRGASISNSFIMLDEAQNATYAQLHMLLTRISQNTKVVITGDASQTDLYGNKVENPLLRVQDRFQIQPHPQVSLVTLTRADIVRSQIIKWLDERLSPEYQPDEHDFVYWEKALSD